MRTGNIDGVVGDKVFVRDETSGAEIGYWLCYEDAVCGIHDGKRRFVKNVGNPEQTATNADAQSFTS